jgi:hypothetical protein
MFCGVTSVDIDFFIEAVELAYGNPRGLSAEELDRDQMRMMVLFSHMAVMVLNDVPRFPQDTRTSWAKLTAELRRRYSMYAHDEDLLGRHQTDEKQDEADATQEGLGRRGCVI